MALQAKYNELKEMHRKVVHRNQEVEKKLVQLASEEIGPSNLSLPERLVQENVKKLEGFLNKIEADTYPEPLSEPHVSITRQMFDYFINKYPLPTNSKILDVGCGQGVALDLFSKEGHNPIGITINEEDLSVCRDNGFQVYQMDQSFLDFEDESFDFIWCRHCIEHSIFPYFTLSEFFRVIKAGGYLYIEVPAPDTSCRHQTNINHYSVLGKSMWIDLIERTGFKIADVIDLSFEVPSGPDCYWAMIQQKDGR